MSPRLRSIQKSSWLLCAERCLPNHQQISLGSGHPLRPPVRAICSRTTSGTSLDSKFARLKLSDVGPRSASTFKSKSFTAMHKPNCPRGVIAAATTVWRRELSTTSGSAAVTNNHPSTPAHNSSSVSNRVSLESPSTVGGGGGFGSVNRAVEQMMKQVPMLLSTVTGGLVNIWKSKKSEKSVTDRVQSSSTNRSETTVAVATEAEVKVVAKPASHKLPTVTKASLTARARFLVQSVSSADSNMAYYTRIEELAKFLRQYPETQSVITKVGAVRLLMLAKQGSADPSVHEAANETLALLGYCKPPRGWGVRILSIDGGGLRGIMALEILHQLEELTGQPVHRMFDYICGVSTGAILAVLLGALKFSVPRCEDLYRQIGAQVFTQNTLWGTGKLVMSHAFFDTNEWTRLVREHIGEQLLSQTPRDPECPKISAISTVVSRPRLEAFLFRNYEYPPRVRSVYPGTNDARLWEAVRASAAAPGYFEEFAYEDEIHQDGGILINNPTALALHECKQLWPGEAVQCVISLGSGRYEPQHAAVAQKYTGLKDKVMKIIDSATDTEAVHTILHDLLPPNIYYRINPYLSENIPLHEARAEKILKLQDDAKMYLRRNEPKLKMAAALLRQPRGRLQSVQDFVSLKSNIYFG